MYSTILLGGYPTIRHLSIGYKHTQSCADFFYQSFLLPLSTVWLSADGTWQEEKDNRLLPFGIYDASSIFNRYGSARQSSPKPRLTPFSPIIRYLWYQQTYFVIAFVVVFLYLPYLDGSSSRTPDDRRKLLDYDKYTLLSSGIHLHTQYDAKVFNHGDGLLASPKPRLLSGSIYRFLKICNRLSLLVGEIYL